MCEHHFKKIILTPNFQHYAKEVCATCGKWIRWITHPENEGKRTRTSRFDLKKVCEHRNIKTPFCFFCTRIKEQLGINETLTIDHILPLHTEGKDELDNTQILCTACHKLKNWKETYITNHLQGGFKG